MMPKIGGQAMIVLPLLALPCPAPAQQPDSLLGLFAYDAAAPLDVRDSVVSTIDAITIHDLTFPSPKGGRVTAYLVVPPGPGPFAAVLFGHWGPGNRTEFLPEAILYARLGVVSLLVDWPWVRPPEWRRAEGPLEQPEKDREVHIQAVVDLRRGLDVLLARSGVDTSRVGYIGHSYGAQFGAILSAIDRRVHAAVLMAGVPDDATFLVETEQPDWVAFRNRYTQAQIDHYVAVNRPLNAIAWVGRIAPTPILMQFAQFDPGFGEISMRRYAAAAREPKKVLWYLTGHELNDPHALIDRATWLAGNLGLSSPLPLLRSMLEPAQP